MGCLFVKFDALNSNSRMQFIGREIAGFFVGNCARLLYAGMFLIATVSLLVSGQEQRPDNGDRGPALAASINGPGGVAVDGDGNLFVVERNGFRIRRVDVRTGTISTVAGNGKQCCFKEGSPADSSSLRYPVSVALDSRRNIYVADTLASIRRVDAKTGFMTTIVREGPASYRSNPGKAPSFEDSEQIEGVAINPDDPKGVLYAIGGLGHLYRIYDTSIAIVPIADRSVSIHDPHVVSSIDPVGVAVDTVGNLFIADYKNCRIHRIEAGSNVISTIAGNGVCKSSGDGGPATSATVDHPVAIAVDGTGNLYFTDDAPSCVRRIDAQTGIVSAIPGTCEIRNGQQRGPSGLAVDSRGNLYFTLWVSNLVKKLDAMTGVVTTVAGNGLPNRRDQIQ